MSDDWPDKCPECGYSVFHLVGKWECSVCGLTGGESLPAASSHPAGLADPMDIAKAASPRLNGPIDFSDTHRFTGRTPEGHLVHDPATCWHCLNQSPKDQAGEIIDQMIRQDFEDFMADRPSYIGTVTGAGPAK